jgi:hypothetical protein
VAAMKKVKTTVSEDDSFTILAGLSRERDELVKIF